MAEKRNDLARNLSTVFRVPDHYLLVSGSAIKLWLMLAATRDQASLTTSEQMGAQIGLSRNTVDRARQELEAIGWVEIIWEERQAGRFGRWRAVLLNPPVELSRRAVKYYQAQLNAAGRALDRKRHRLQLASRGQGERTR